MSPVLAGPVHITDCKIAISKKGRTRNTYMAGGTNHREKCPKLSDRKSRDEIAAEPRTTAAVVQDRCGSGIMINHSRRFGAHPAGKGGEAHTAHQTNTAEGGMNWKHLGIEME